MATPRETNKSMLAYVLEQLELCRGEWPTVERDSGVSIRTIQKIAQGETVDPGVSTAQRLFDCFKRREAKARKAAA